MQSISHNKLTWLLTERPDADDISYLQSQFDLHPLIIGQLTTPVYRPQFSEHNDYFFAVVHFPIFTETGNFKETGEIDILVNKKFVVTVCSHSDSPIHSFFSKCFRNNEIAKKYFRRGPYYLLLIIISQFLKNQFPFLDELAQKTGELERRLFSLEESRTLREITYLQRDIIEMRKIIKPQLSILRSIFAKEEIKADPYLSAYAQDVVATNIQIWNTLENYWETVNALHRTNNTMVSYKLNRSINILSAFSIMFFSATLVSSIFGMEVDIPPAFRDIKMVFTVMITVMGITAFALFFLMRRRTL